MDKPLAFCLTPTYGRFHLLQEMLWCWVNQTYSNKRLLIVNDQPNLTIECDIPGVEIHNIPVRFGALGAKRGYMHQHIPAEAEFVIPMDDDDIFFEDHIERLIEASIKNPSHARTKNRINYTSTDNQFTGSNTTWGFFGASCFRADVYRTFTVRSDYVWAEDSDMMQRHGVTTYEIPEADSTFIYRSGMGVVHASGHGLPFTDPASQGFVHAKIENGTNQLSLPTTKKLTPNITPATLALIDGVRVLRMNTKGSGR